MDITSISGERARHVLENFDYIRAAGTPGEAKACEMICDQLKKIGLEPERETFSFTGYEVEKAALMVTEPYEKEYAVGGYLFSQDTGEEGIEAEFMFAEDADPVTMSMADKKVVLISRRVTREDYELLEKAGAVGFISVCGTPIDESKARVPAQLRLAVKEAGMPGVCIHDLDAREMYDRYASRVRMFLRQKKRRIQSANVTVSIPGKTCPEEIIALTAHYDSVPAGKGAYDNMAGVVILLEACRYFLQNRPDRTVEFTFLGSEERGLCGSRAFLEKHSGERKYCLNINIDLAGQALGGTVLGVTADKSLCVLLEQLLWECRIGAKIRHSVWASDSNTFAYHGIPAITMNRDGFGMHTIYDTIELISARTLETEARLLCFLTEKIAKMNPLPFSEEIPKDMSAELEEYFQRLPSL